MMGPESGMAPMFTWPSAWITLLACCALIWGGRLVLTVVRVPLGPGRRAPESLATASTAVLLHYLAWQWFSGLGLRAKGVFIFPGPDLRWWFLFPAALALFVLLVPTQGQLTRRRALSGVVLNIGMLPLWDGLFPEPLAVMVATLVGGLVLALVRGVIPRGHALPWRRSIKDAADKFGDGVAFFDARANPVLVNRRMTSLAGQLGVPVSDMDRLWAAMAGTPDDGYGGAPDATDDSMASFAANGTVFMGYRNRVLGRRGRWYTEIRAVDVTESARANQELMEDNVRLRAAMARTRELLESIGQIEREQVLLDFRTRLHDVVAQRVSVVHRFLESGVGTPERLATLGAMLTDVRAEIGSDHASPPTLLRRVRESFATAGVTVDVAGELPADVAHAATAVRIIRQAATNAVAHGAATSVSAVFEGAVFGDARPGWRLTVSNDGDVPPEVTEGTGLSGLRLSVEALGGTLRYEAGDRFRLVAEVPGGSS